jgi:hypothetical protein
MKQYLNQHFPGHWIGRELSAELATAITRLHLPFAYMRGGTRTIDLVYERKVNIHDSLVF